MNQSPASKILGVIVFAVMFFVGFTFVRNRNSTTDLVYKGRTLSVDEAKKAMTEIKELTTALSQETLEIGEIKTPTTTELSTDFKAMMLLTKTVEDKFAKDTEGIDVTNMLSAEKLASDGGRATTHKDLNRFTTALKEYETGTKGNVERIQGFLSNIRTTSGQAAPSRLSEGRVLLDAMFSSFYEFLNSASGIVDHCDKAKPRLVSGSLSFGGPDLEKYNALNSAHEKGAEKLNAAATKFMSFQQESMAKATESFKKMPLN
ncbi:MAG: hypothetical protein JST35_00865 [Armatimonadetes bacterium]|nr:hypothetical protein [Armatimonadota bacterium]